MMLLALVLAAQTAMAPVRVGGNMPAPQKIKDVKPVYPTEAQQSGVQGLVILEAIIDPAGKVSEARVMRSIPMLDQAAIDAVRQWEYTPTLLNGTPVPVIMTVTVNFTLQGSNAPPTQSVAPPNASTIRLSLARAQDGVTTVWEITAERAAALPRWSLESPALPLSIEEAVRIAEAWLKGRSPEVQRFELQSVSFSRVRRSNPEVDFWHYQIFFLNYSTPPRPGDQASRVVVLPDGTVVEPRTEQGRPVPVAVTIEMTFTLR